MDNKINLPKTWAVAKLVDIAHINMGQSPPSSTYNSNGDGLPFYQGKADFGNIFPTATKYCSQPVKTVEKNDILISVRAPIGPTNIAQAKSCIGRGLAGINAYGEIPNKYIFYYFRLIENEIVKLGTGSTFTAISKNNLEDIEIPIPPIQEQHFIVEKIEELFSELDNSLVNLNKINHQLKIYRHVLLRDAFEGKLTQKWRKGKGFESIDEIINAIQSARQDYNFRKNKEWQVELEIWKKNGRIGAKPLKPKEEIKPVEILRDSKNLPDNWNLTTLGSIGNLSSGQHILEKDHFSFENGLPYLTGPSNFGKIYPTYARWSPYPKVLAYPDDILITVKGSGVGKINMLNTKASIGRQLMAFTSFYNNKWFIYYYLQSQLRSLNGLSSGTAIPGINRESILSFECPLIPSEEQDAIVQEIQSQMSIIENLEKLSKLCQDKVLLFRQLVLKNAYSGKLIRQNKDFQNADEFLKQIKAYRITYQETQKEQKKLVPKIKSMVKDRLEILEIMKIAGRPILAKELWEQSIYSENIELFYAELKKVEDKIEELHKGFLSLRKDENR